MLEARSKEEFGDRPEGGYVAGESWISFCFDLSLFGFALWGSPSRADIRALMDLLGEFERPPHSVLADVSGVEVMAPPSFDEITAFVSRRFDDLAKMVMRAAIVRPRGFNGALASGFFSAAPAPFEVSFHDVLVEAMRELGRDEDEAHALLVAREAVEGVSPLLRALRLHLDGDPEPAIESAATAMQLSVRALQRQLTELGTSYSLELQETRVRRAEKLLADTDEPLTSIAFEIGCASPQHFSSLFKKHRGATPSEFRAQKRPK